MTHHSTGLQPWLLQRISAVYLGVFLVYFVVSLLICGELDYAEWYGWLTHPVMSVATAGFIFALLIHGWVGMRNIILDYASHIGVRLLLLTGVWLLLAGCGIWSLQILIRAVVQ